MTSINNLFFELIQVAIGTRICLSHTPSADEWGELYNIAKKQSLVGVCFAGVQKLVLQEQTPEEMLYLTWMGMAAKIQQRNEVVNKRCVELQRGLNKEGYRCCIFKGQSVASYYPRNLTLLRQSGDIDVWVDASPSDLYNLVKFKFSNKKIHKTNLHYEVPIFSDVVVELHQTPTYLRNPYYNHKLQKWLDKVRSGQMNNSRRTLSDDFIISPMDDCHVIILILHAYRHLVGEGIGLRQVLDIYYALQTKGLNLLFIRDCLVKLGLENFLGGLMWLMSYILKLPNKYLIYASDETQGRYLINEILNTGNFGHTDSRIQKDTRLNRSKLLFHRNWVQIRYYSKEAIFTFFWRFVNGCKRFLKK